MVATFSPELGSTPAGVVSPARTVRPAAFSSRHGSGVVFGDECRVLGTVGQVTHLVHPHPRPRVRHVDLGWRAAGERHVVEAQPVGDVVADVLLEQDIGVRVVRRGGEGERLRRARARDLELLCRQELGVVEVRPGLDHHPDVAVGGRGTGDVEAQLVRLPGLQRDLLRDGRAVRAGARRDADAALAVDHLAGRVRRPPDQTVVEGPVDDLLGPGRAGRGRPDADHEQHTEKQGNRAERSEPGHEVILSRRRRGRRGHPRPVPRAGVKVRTRRPCCVVSRGW